MEKLSVITVCRNAEKEIEKTFASLKAQSTRLFEYIIIDGKSTDNTIEIVKKFISDNPDIKISYISEPDSGIYNAMNKALKLCDTTWIYYLNAGDTLFNTDVLKTIINNLDKAYDFIYGDACYLENGLPYMVPARDIDEITKRIPFTHQAVINKKDSLVELFGYDEKYKMCADYDLYLRGYLHGYKYKKIESTICYYVVEGATQKNQFLVLKENKHIKQELLNDAQTYTYTIKIVKLWFSTATKKVLPRKVVNWIKQVKYNKW